MQTAIAHPSAIPANHGSRTMTQTNIPAVPEAGPSTPNGQPGEANSGHTVGVLKLRGGPLRRQKVVWAEETVDNEGMGKKKSKICCIYHKPKAYDESSSESDSSCGSEDEHPPRQPNALRRRDGQGGEVEGSSESDGGTGGGSARPAHKGKARRHKHNHTPGCDNGVPTHKPNKYDHQGPGGGERGKSIP